MSTYKKRPTTTCQFCGVDFDRSNIRRHSDACARLPAGDALQQMLDNDRRVTAYAIAQQFDVPLPVTYAKILATTDWDRDGLNWRGEMARRVNVGNTTAINSKYKQAKIDAGFVFCMFCEIAGDHSVCPICESALTRFIDAGSVPSEWARVLYRLHDRRHLPAKYEEIFSWLWKRRETVSG